jgi:AcrR family transcriptional regulator
MGRPRTVDDETLLDSALRIVRESGPDSLSFGALAARVDLAASTLVQRFGSKQNLLRAALSLAWDRLDQDTARAIANAGGGRAGVIDLLVALSGQYRADDFADQLLILREDLRDPVLRERGRVWIGVLADAIEARLRTARRNPDGLGQLVVTHWQGSLTVWAFQRQQPIADNVRTALETLFGRLRIS